MRDEHGRSPTGASYDHRGREAADGIAKPGWQSLASGGSGDEPAVARPRLVRKSLRKCLIAPLAICKFLHCLPCLLLALLTRHFRLLRPPDVHAPFKAQKNWSDRARDYRSWRDRESTPERVSSFRLESDAASCSKFCWFACGTGRAL